MTDNNVTIEYTELDALRAELETARVEASDLAGQLRDVRTDRDQWQAAHAERSAKVAELQAECDALHKSEFSLAQDCDDLSYSAHMVRKRGDTYRARALALLGRIAKIRAWYRMTLRNSYQFHDEDRVRLVEEHDRANAAERENAALREWLELIRKGIDPEIGDDGLKDETILAMIDAALAATPAPNRGGGSEGSEQ